MRSGRGLKIAGGGVIGGLLFLIVIIVMIITVIAAPMGAIVGAIGGSNKEKDINANNVSLSGFVMPIDPGAIKPQFDLEPNYGINLIWPNDTASDYMLPAYKAKFGWDHNGIDIQTNGGSPKVRATHKGIVADVSYGCGNTLGQPWSTQCPASTDNTHNSILAGGGNYVLIEITDLEDDQGILAEGEKLFAVLCHMKNDTDDDAKVKDARVNKGDVVEAGQALGEPGNTGNSDGIHGHFMLLKGYDYKTAQHINPGIVAKGWPGYEYLVMYKNER